MHILLVHQAFTTLSEPGGTRHHEMACRFVEEGHRVTVLSGQVSYLTGRETVDRKWVRREVDGHGVEVLRAYTYQAWHRSFLHRLFSFLSFMVSSFVVGLGVREVDLVWGTTPPLFQGITAWLLARLKGAAFLLEVRDLWPAFAVAVGVLRNPILIRLSEGLEKYLYRRANHVVVNSPGFEKHVLDRGAKGVDMVPNGVDVAMFEPEKDGAAYRRMHDLEEKFVVLYAGAHGLSNDLRVLLLAADLLREKNNIAFVLVGDGKEKGHLMDLAREMELDNVQFHPSVPKDQMPEILAAADVCIAILKPIEAFKTTYPNKVFDYMAAGRAVILAIDGVIRKVIEDAGAGIFIQPGDANAMADAVLRLEGDRFLREEMGRAGRRCVTSNFDRAALADAMLDIMKETVREKGH
jgi:glycosyltransferase involved in cell wall biosynthesis